MDWLSKIIGQFVDTYFEKKQYQSICQAKEKYKPNKFLSQIAFKHCINELNGLIKIFLKSQIGLTYNS